MLLILSRLKSIAILLLEHLFAEYLINAQWFFLLKDFIRFFALVTIEKSKPLLASYYKQPPHCPYIPCEQSESGYRMLSPIECERLQTLPDGYTDGISKTQRYKCIGNGWTVDVIAWILSYLK